MSKSVKALLLSAFVFPGAGHFYLKQFVRGVILSVISISCLSILVTNTVQIAQDISTKIETGEISLDITAIEETVAKEQENNSGLLDATTYLLGICWVFGIIDSFRLGKAQEKADSTK